MTHRVAKSRAGASETSAGAVGPSKGANAIGEGSSNGQQDYLRQHPQVLSQRGGDAIILLSLANGSYYTVEGVAAREWELFDGTRTQHEVGVEISLEYNVPLDRAEADLAALIDDLDSEELLAARD